MKYELQTRLDDAGNDVPAFGFEFQGMFIVDAYESECGRFRVDPSYYGLTKYEADALNIVNATLAAAWYKNEVKS